MRPATACVWRAVFLLLLVACGEPVAPTAFARGQSIPLGPYHITISHAESIAASAVREILPDQSMEQMQFFVVFFNVTGVRSTDIARLRLWFMDFKVVDNTDQTYPGLVPMPLKDYYMMMSQNSIGSSGDYKAMESWWESSSAPSAEWVFLFAVPDKSRGFTLLIGNPTPEAGQVQLAAIPLGR